MPLFPTITAADSPAANSPAANSPAHHTGQRPRLLFLVTEDWYFWSHRLPVARAARDAGFEVVVAARVEVHGERIADEGFRVQPLRWRRRGDGIAGGVRALIEIARLYRRERPDIVHHVALKPVLFGGAAARLAFPLGGGPARIAAVTGLGAGFAAATPLAGIARVALQQGLRVAVTGSRIIVQNPEDGVALARLGVMPGRVTLIPGSGVDTGHFAPLPPPPGPRVTVAFVARMLRSKGVLDAAAAVRSLRGGGLDIALLLAGPTDPDNGDSLDAGAMATLAAEPGIEWLGRVEDVREVWRRAAIAVLPSTYGEGVPKALLEAAACGRAIVASDMPGCRDVVRHGHSGLLTPPHDIAALADALAMLARDPGQRQAMGEAGRKRVEQEFGEDRIARETLALYHQVLRDRKGT
ncbi:MAG TPA: glycosyltransferase family 4 protein [Stellaceae bacterium]|nr:glycosyltransferase family 4 protein [Stellaceae bacterium]